MVKSNQASQKSSGWLNPTSTPKFVLAVKSNHANQNWVGVVESDYCTISCSQSNLTMSAKLRCGWIRLHPLI
jgi:hypothetical protein